MAIRDIESLRSHLQWAIELEHSTIPPYLTAYYSLHESHNRESAGVLLSVAIEEMLHMTLAANVLKQPRRRQVPRCFRWTRFPAGSRNRDGQDCQKTPW